MFINNDRNKLIACIVFFAKRINGLGITKLFKLLSFLDFEHFRQTGKSVTGLEYEALPKGPVPHQLYDELTKAVLPDDLHQAIEVIIKKQHNGSKVYEINALRKHDKDIFTPRETEIMARLVQMFGNETAQYASDISHLPNFAWDKIYQNGTGKGKKIPYELSLESPAFMQDAETIKNDELHFRKQLWD